MFKKKINSINFKIKSSVKLLVYLNFFFKFLSMQIEIRSFNLIRDNLAENGNERCVPEFLYKKTAKTQQKTMSNNK